MIRYIAHQFAKPSGIAGRIATFVMNRMNKKQYCCVLRQISLQRQDVVMDIGFGNGYVIQRLAKMNVGDLHGIDISEDMIQVATRRNRKAVKQGRVHLTNAKVETLPYQDDMFTILYSINTIYFWESLAIGFQAIHRVSKNGAIWICVFYAKKWLDTLPYTKYGFHIYTLEEVKTALRNNGFDIVLIEEIQKGVSYCITSHVRKEGYAYEKGLSSRRT